MQPEFTPPPRYALVNAIPDLLYWSIPWLIAVATTQFLFGIGSLTFLHFYKVEMEHSVPWFAAGVAISCFSAFQLLLVRASAKRYVENESQNELSSYSTQMGSFWVTLSIWIFFIFVSQLSLLSNPFILPLPFSWVPSTLAVGLLVLLSRLDRRSVYSQTDFLKSIHPYAKVMLPRLRFLSVFSIAAGLVLVLFGAGDYLEGLSSFSNQVVANGMALIVLGSYVQWYRRTVRDIFRNATPVFYERTLNRLNFGWILLTVTNLAMTGFYFL